MAAAEVHIKPSKRTGILKSLAAIIDPTIAASSLPPKVARILSGLLKFCPCNSIADLITEILFANLFSSRPVPIPVHASTGCLKRAQAIAVAAVY